MSWLRHGLVPVLLVALLATALATSANHAFAKPTNLKTWLHQSNFYDHFVSYTADQTAHSLSSSTAAQVSSDPGVINAAKKALTPQKFEDSVNSFIDGNYAWLQGKTDKPNFSIDLSQTKDSFAGQAGQYASNRFAALPACSVADLAQIDVQNLNYYTLNCRPPGVSAAAVAELATRQVQQSDTFLTGAPLTADTIGKAVDSGAQSSGQSSTPYYKKLSVAPTLYKLSLVVPWIAGGVAILATLGIILLAPVRRRGVRHVATTLATAGVILVIGKLLADAVFHFATHKLLAAASANQLLQQSVVDISHHAETTLARTDFWFGLGYLLLAVGLFMYLRVSRPPVMATQDTPHPIAETTPAANPPEVPPTNLIQL